MHRRNFITKASFKLTTLWVKDFTISALQKVHHFFVHFLIDILICWHCTNFSEKWFVSGTRDKMPSFTDLSREKLPSEASLPEVIVVNRTNDSSLQTMVFIYLFMLFNTCFLFSNADPSIIAGLWGWIPLWIHSQHRSKNKNSCVVRVKFHGL